MRLTLVMATRNRATALSRFLERLASMPHPLDWEIVIADNGSSDDTVKILDYWASRLPLTAVHAPVRGKSRALNAALALVSGDLILFTDDDVQPPPDWLIRWVDCANRYPISTVFGGRITIDESNAPGWIVSSGNLQEMLLSRHDLGDQDQTYPFNRYPIGPNMAVRRDALIASGARWLENFGPGTPVPLGDEYAFLGQISKPEDGSRVYLADVAVAHLVEANRLTRINCWKRCFLGGLAAGRIDRSLPSRRVPVGAPAISRLLTCRSLSELVAMVYRALGVLVGRWGY